MEKKPKFRSRKVSKKKGVKTKATEEVERPH